MTTETKQFAPGVSKDEHGWYLFARDVPYRKKLFPDKVFEHPAKANMYLIEALVDYLTKPGDSIIDPFGGTGTLLLAARRGRKAVLIDVEDQYVDLQKETMENWRQAGTELADTYIYHGDNKQVLQQIPYQCDASIFSPPYSSALQASTGFKDHKDSLGQYGGKQASALNLGRLNPFYYAQAIDTVYQRLASKLVPGAPVAILTKDIMKGEQRVFISESTIQRCQRHGLKLESWMKWKPPGSMMHSVVKAKGGNVVDEEDILIFRKQP